MYLKIVFVFFFVFLFIFVDQSGPRSSRKCSFYFVYISLLVSFIVTLLSLQIVCVCPSLLPNLFTKKFTAQFIDDVAQFTAKTMIIVESNLQKKGIKNFFITLISRGVGYTWWQARTEKIPRMYHRRVYTFTTVESTDSFEESK